jgi:hypothetical protein
MTSPSLPLAALLQHSLFEWSNWTFGLVAVCYVVFSELREAKRTRQLRQISIELEPSAVLAHGLVGEPSTMALPIQSDALLNDRLRSILIQVGVEGQPFSLAVERAHRLGVPREAVEDAARALSGTKLLRFNEPLNDDTKIRLN